MLYSIIPPVLVVVSLAGIIIFLMKKAPAVARLKDNSELLSEEEKNEESLSVRYAALRRENKRPLKEKISKVFGGLFLFFGNFFTSSKEALHKINSRAKEKIADKRIVKNDHSMEESADDIFQKKLDKQIEIVDEEVYAPEVRYTEILAENGETVRKEERESKSDKKDLFEKILIDRIASNPKDIEAYERLGEYYLEIENWEYAKECFKQVLKLNPRNIGIRSKMRKLERILSK